MLIKIMNKEIAMKLAKKFPYTTENYKQQTGEMVVYCFEATPEFLQAFRKYEKHFDYDGPPAVRDNKMRF